MDDLDQQLAIRFPAHLKARLEAEAAQTGRTLSGLIRWILMGHAASLPVGQSPSKAAKPLKSKRQRKPS